MTASTRLLALLLLLAAWAATAAAVPSAPDEIVLLDGSGYACRVQRLEDERIVLTWLGGRADTLALSGVKSLRLYGLGDVYTAEHGLVYMPTHVARTLEKRALPAAEPEAYRPGDHELLLMPTASTMPKGSSYFSVYELFFLNYVYAPTDNTHIGAFFLFPITADFVETASLGVKQRVLRRERVETALWGSWMPRTGAVTAGATTSLELDGGSLHAGLGGLTLIDDHDRSSEWLLMLGYRLDVRNRVSLHVEYATADAAQDWGGLLSLGIRFRGESIAWDIGGVRPLTETDGLLFLPMLKATWQF